MCGGDNTNYESRCRPKNGGCEIGIKAVHMRAVGEPNGEVASAEVKVIYRVCGASLFQSRVERRL